MRPQNVKGNAGGVPSQSNPFQSTRTKRRFVVNSKLVHAKRKVKYVRFPAERIRRFIKAPVLGNNVFAIQSSFVARQAAFDPKEAA